MIFRWVAFQLRSVNVSKKDVSREFQPFSYDTAVVWISLNFLSVVFEIFCDIYVKGLK